jgi:hypothetical protein
VHGGAEVIKMDGAGAADGPGHRPPADIVELRLTGERLFTTAVVIEPGEVLAVPVTRLQAAISQDQALGQWIIRAMFAWRQWLSQMQTGLRIVGSRSSPQTRRHRGHLPHDRRHRARPVRRARRVLLPAGGPRRDPPR